MQFTFYDIFVVDNSCILRIYSLESNYFVLYLTLISMPTVWATQDIGLKAKIQLNDIEQHCGSQDEI